MCIYFEIILVNSRFPHASILDNFLGTSTICSHMAKWQHMPNSSENFNHTRPYLQLTYAMALMNIYIAVSIEVRESIQVWRKLIYPFQTYPLCLGLSPLLPIYFYGTRIEITFLLNVFVLVTFCKSSKDFQLAVTSLQEYTLVMKYYFPCAIRKIYLSYRITVVVSSRHKVLDNIFHNSICFKLVLVMCIQGLK